MQSRYAAAIALCLVVAAAPLTTAGAQQSPHPAMPTNGPSSLPAGNATIRGVVTDASDIGASGGLTVALYALQPDGTPGIGSVTTAADGSFVFEGVSNDPAIVYLVGVRYADVPYGERTAFVAGQTEIDLAIPVARPTSDPSGTRVVSSSLRIEAMGSRLAVEEVHEIRNDGPTPILVPMAARAEGRAPFQATLPDGAIEFQTGVFNDSGAFSQDGLRVRYWGPVYSGEQEIRFGYQLEIAPGAGLVELEKAFPTGTGAVRVLTPTHGPEVESRSLREGQNVDVDGTSHRVQESDGLPPGGVLALRVRVPETTSAPGTLQLGRAEVAVELDDTVLEVTQTHEVRVEPGAHVAGSPGAPLLRFELPLPAEITGISTEARRLGVRSHQQGVEVLGPLGPGTHSFSFRYRLPAGAGGTRLDLRFPEAVPVLQLRVADTGLVIESDRLHRLRPEAMGTRTWMLREAFHIGSEEVLSIRFEPLTAHGPSRAGTLFFVTAAGAIVLLFVVAPLRASHDEGGERDERGERAPEADARRGAAHERNLVYATIRDLEHDYETGKVSADDFERTRQELWTRAIELMREERARTPVATLARAAEPPPAAGGVCPACDGKIAPTWLFCSHCGGVLQPLEGSESTG